MEQKKRWMKPQLIILGKGTSDEYVLSGCKYSGAKGPTNNQDNCHTNKCQIISTS